MTKKPEGKRPEASLATHARMPPSLLPPRRCNQPLGGLGPCLSTAPRSNLLGPHPAPTLGAEIASRWKCPYGHGGAGGLKE